VRDALSDLRPANLGRNPKDLWADARCVDQSNISERNKQIQMIANIYRDATGVTTYIGPEAEGSEQALNFALRLDEYATLHWNDPTDIQMTEDLHRLPEIGFPEPRHWLWEAFRSLLQRPWWSRAWIAQEFVLNKDNAFVCEKPWVPGLYFLTFLSYKDCKRSQVWY
jgi:hypothetical protein